MSSGEEPTPENGDGRPQPTRDALIFGMIVVLMIAVSIFFPA